MSSSSAASCHCFLFSAYVKTICQLTCLRLVQHVGLDKRQTYIFHVNGEHKPSLLLFPPVLPFQLRQSITKRQYKAIGALDGPGY